MKNDYLKGNPILEKTSEHRAVGREAMTYEGTAIKTLFLISLVFAAACWSYKSGLELSQGWVWGSSIGGFVLGLVTIFNQNIAKYTAPVYSLLQGVVLGYVSVFADLKYPGISFEAIMATISILFTMVGLYGFRVIRVNHKFMAAMFAAMMGILVIYLGDIILGFFGIQIPIVHESSIWGILFSVGVVLVATLSIAIDLHQIEESVTEGASKDMEWYGAFGLIVTLVWLYLEVLRLFMKLRDK